MKIADLIREFCEETDGCEVYENYSGRGMFGSTCMGIVVEKDFSYMKMIVKLTRFLDRNDFDNPESELEGMMMDSLGLDTIMYFPNIQG